VAERMKNPRPILRWGGVIFVKCGGESERERGHDWLAAP